MKRTTKSVFALVIVIAMCFSFCVPTFVAAEGTESHAEAACPGSAVTHSKANCSDYKVLRQVERQCGTTGYTQYECNVCHAQFIDDILPASTQHTMLEIENVPASCTTPGYKIEKCQNADCFHEVRTDFPVLPHTPGTPVAEDSTCTDTTITYVTYCTVCGTELNRTSQDKLQSGHNWVLDYVIDAPSCEHDGLAQMKCANEDCTEVKTEVLFKETYAAHNWVDVNQAVAPTCSTQGTMNQKCTQCNATRTTDIPATGAHNMTGVVTPVAATCTTPGVVGGTYCVLCNYGKTAAEAPVAALGHTESLIAEIHPTCLEEGGEGSRTYQCSVCGNERTETVAKLPHSYGDTPSEYKAPTCLGYGYQLYACTVCGYSNVDSDDVILEPLGHTEATRQESVVPATCTDAGSYNLVTYCSECDIVIKTEPKTEAALGHDIVKVDIAPSCFDVGHKYEECVRAGCTYETEAVAYGEKDADNHALVITRDGVKDDANSVSYLVDVNTTAATCISTGMQLEYCNKCSHYVETELEALGHDWVMTSETPATCGNPGTPATKTYECSRCPETKTESEGNPAGHTEATTIENEVLATCTTGGSYTLVTYCSVCTLELKREDKTTNANGHTWATDAEGNTVYVSAISCVDEKATLTRTCTVCTFEDTFDNPAVTFDRNNPEHHNGTLTRLGAYRDATCVLLGIDKYECDACEKEFHVTLETVLGCENWKIDDPNNAAADPTCTADGKYETYECSSCHKTYYINADGETVEYTADEYVLPALGHDFADATCTLPMTCTRCGATDGAPNGHVWAEATCTAPKTCTVCGATDGTALGHDNVILPGYAATCTATGLTEGKQCQRCNVITTAQTVIPMIDHTYVAVVAPHVDATCELEGYTYVVEKCSCGALNPEYTNGEYLKDYEPALGHNYQYDRTEGLTCLTDGVEIEKCANCGNERNGATVTCRGYHANAAGEKLEASCLNIGVTDRVCVMTTGEVCSTIVAEHNIVTVNVPATCTEYSYVLEYCTGCTYSYVDPDSVGTNVLGHEWSAWAIDPANGDYAATVLNPGQESSKCSKCNQVKTQVIPALPGIEFVYDVENVEGGSVIANSNTFNVIISTNAVNIDVFTISLKLKYDTSVIKFVGGELLNDNFESYTMTSAGRANGEVVIIADVVSALADESLRVNTTLNAEGEAFAVLTFVVNDVVDFTKGIDISVVLDGDQKSSIVDVDNNVVPATFGTGADHDVAVDRDIVKLGNLAGDENITVTDANKIVDIAKEDVSGDDEYCAEADVNKDGVVDLKDYTFLRLYLVGNITYEELCAITPETQPADFE